MYTRRQRTALFAIVVLTPIACLFPNVNNPFAPPPDPKAAKEAADGTAAFAAELYAQVRGHDGNLIVSPYSISTALAMTAAGAEGDTRAQLDRVVHLPPGDKLGPDFRAMTASVTAVPKGAKNKPELSVANSIWAQKGHPWKREYLNLTRDYFRRELYDADFSRDPDTARGRINQWVDKETRGRITNLVPVGALDANTRMVLANAIYFKADWAAKFEKNSTQPLPFTLASGQQVQAPLMHQQGEFWLLEEQGLQVLKLPYDGKATSMYVLLPGAANGLPILEQQLSAANLRKWTDGNPAVPGGPAPVQPQQVKVWLPKFKFTVPVELADALQRMGVRDAFDPQRANFRGMSESAQGLFVSRVIHKAFVEVDEAGTEAAAATAVVMSLASAPGPRPMERVKEFRADRPFLFVIKQEATGAPLFIGRVTDPTK